MYFTIIFLISLTNIHSRMIRLSLLSQITQKLNNKINKLSTAHLLWLSTVHPIHREKPVELQQYETVGGGSAPQYEVTERAGVEYEEIDRLRETREQPHPPTGDYELIQCPAYGPVNRDTT